MLIIIDIVILLICFLISLSAYPSYPASFSAWDGRVSSEEAQKVSRVRRAAGLPGFFSSLPQNFMSTRNRRCHGQSQRGRGGHSQAWLLL
jgi:hypothetical protein